MTRPTCPMCGLDLSGQIPQGFVLVSDPGASERTIFLSCPSCGKLCIFVGRDRTGIKEK